MDNYDKTRSMLGNSTATPEAGLAHATGLEEHPTCDSDVYLGYLQAPTREIINAIEAAGLTRDATDLTQLSQAVILLGKSGGKIAQGTATGATGIAAVTLTKASDEKWGIIVLDVMWVLSAQGSVRYDSIALSTGTASTEVSTLVKSNIYTMQLVDDPTGEAKEHVPHTVKIIPSNKTVNSLTITLNYTLTGDQSQHTIIGEGSVSGV